MFNEKEINTLRGAVLAQVISLANLHENATTQAKRTYLAREIKEHKQILSKLYIAESNLINKRAIS